MAAALRILCLVGIFTLTACYKTDLPTYPYSKPGYSKQSQTAQKQSYSTYRVRKGDTLYSIGKRFGVDHKLLARRNHIGWPYTIYVGQRLSLTRTAPKPQYMPIPRTKTKQATPRTSTGSTKKAVSKKVSATSHNRPAINGSVKLRWPLNARVTSRFGRRGSRMHDGIDIGAKEGTPVYAAAAGEVVYSDQRLSGYGKLIIIRHSRDMFTAYAHNQRNLVRKGNRVKSGDVIARVGRTGRASGPHLHFEVRRGSTPVDPLAYLPRR
ncbi:MAG: M23 family metallopeptidase [Mariprofundaceae bacterium]|nr:M23 family metallopeptidase [Mariprofundaceae bacterium]